MYRTLLVAALAAATLNTACAQSEGDGAPPPAATLSPMRFAALAELVRKIDPKAHVEANSAQFSVESRTLVLVADERAGRMRVMTPVARADALERETLERMLQANFDAVLDARYALARGLVWSAYLHPLATLDAARFADAVSQVYIAAETFGSTYTSGALVYGGGDSQAEHEALRARIAKRLESSI